MVVQTHDILLLATLTMCGIILTVCNFVKDAKTRSSKNSWRKKCKCTSCKRDERLRRIEKLPFLGRIFRTTRVEEVEYIKDNGNDEQEVGGAGYDLFASWDVVGPAALVDMSYGNDDVQVLESELEIRDDLASDDSANLLDDENEDVSKWAHLDIDHVVPGSRIEFVRETSLGPSNRVHDAKLEEHIHVEWLQNNPRNANKVSVMRHQPSGDLRVVKTRSIPYDKSGHLLMPYELDLMRDIVKPHTNLVQFLGHDLVEDGGNGGHSAADDDDRHDAVCHIFLEHCEFGDLHSFMDRWDRYQGPYIPSIFLLHTWASLSSALGFLHCGIREANGRLERDDDAVALVHCDIKPQNIFLRWTPYTKYGMPDIVLGDLGLCTPYDSWRNRGACGTLDYQPPEVEWVSEALYGEPDEVSLETYMNASKTRYNRLWSPAGDVWAVGAVMAELATLKATRPVSMLFSSDIWGIDLNKLFWVSIEKMLHDDADKRITSETLASLALKMRSDVAYLYEHGERMPDDCWKDLETSINTSEPYPAHSFSTCSANQVASSSPRLEHASSLYSRSLSTKECRARVNISRAGVTSLIPSPLQIRNSAFVHRGTSKPDRLTTSIRSSLHDQVNAKDSNNAASRAPSEGGEDGKGVPHQHQQRPALTL